MTDAMYGVGPCINRAVLQVGVAAALPCSVTQTFCCSPSRKKKDSLELLFLHPFFSAVQNAKRARKQKQALNLGHKHQVLHST